MKTSIKSAIYIILISNLLLVCDVIAKHAITLYGEDPKYPADFSHFDFVNPDAPKGGTLKLADYGTFDSFNPFIAKGNVEGNIGLIYESLTYQSPDEPFTVYGLLAEDIERAEDNSSVTFKINPKARWHDGKSVTAQDVKFTFEQLLQHGHPYYQNYYADVDNVEIIDNLTIRFNFKHAGNRELPLILGSLQIIPQHFWQDKDITKTSLEPPLGSGPYKIGKVNAGRSISYDKVKNWWGENLPVNKGLYNFDHINIDYYRDMAVALEAFKGGQFDFRLEYSAKDWAQGYVSKALEDGRIQQIEIPNHNPSGMQAYIFNLRKPIFQDIRVRKALNLLFDFEWSNRQLFFNSYQRTVSYFQGSELAATDLPDSEELKLLEPLKDDLPAQLFKQVFTLPQTDGSGMIRNNKRLAYRLLTEAGFKIVDDKMITPSGLPFKFEFMNHQASLERVLLPFKRNLAELGIEMEIRRVDTSQFINRMRSRDFDMTSAIWGQSNSPGNEQREFWHSSSSENHGSRNFIGIQNKAVDTLVEKLIAASSRAELITAAKALDRVLQWNYYLIPNYHSPTWRIAYWNKFGYPQNTAKYDYVLMSWWQKHKSPVKATKSVINNTENPDKDNLNAIIEQISTQSINDTIKENAESLDVNAEQNNPNKNNKNNTTHNAENVSNKMSEKEESTAEKIITPIEKAKE